MSTIRSGTNVGIISTQARMDAGVEGQRMGAGTDETFDNPALAQISTLTLAEQADVSDEIIEDQVWTIVLTDPLGVTITTLYTVTAEDDTAGTDALGLAYMAGVLAAALEGNVELQNVVDAVGVGPDIQLTWKHPAQGVFTFTAVCTPAAAEPVLLATPATSQDAGGVEITMGRVVVYGTPVAAGTSELPRASLPTAVGDQLAGIATRDLAQPRADVIPFATVPIDNVYPIASLVGVRTVGRVRMVNQSANDAAAGGPVHYVVNTTGGDLLGQTRADRAGVADVFTATPTPLNDAAYRLTVSLADVDGLGAMTRSFPFTADGTATDAEIVTGIQLAMGADAAFTARVVASGTTTLILTGQEEGVAMTVTDTQDQGAAVVGAWASIVNTTPAVPYTARAAGWTWHRQTPASSIGVVKTA